MHSEQPSQVMRPATGFHRDHARRKLTNVLDQRLSTHRSAHHYRARSVNADYAARVLAQMTPRITIDIGPFLSLLYHRHHIRCPGKGAGHSIITEDELPSSVPILVTLQREIGRPPAEAVPGSLHCLSQKLNRDVRSSSSTFSVIR
jgi:hypothetical protein